MKKGLIKKILALIFLIIVFLVFNSCILALIDIGANVSVDVIIPDYYRCPDGESLIKINPEKTIVQLSYYNPVTRKYIIQSELKLSESERTPIYCHGEEINDFPAGNYNFGFNRIPDSFHYGKDKLRIELYDENGYEIDCYSNFWEKELNPLYCSCFSVFSNRNLPENQIYTLLPNEIRIHPQALERDKSYNFKINSNQADVLVLDFDGLPEEYYSNSQISENKTDIFYNVYYENLFLAVWNPSDSTTEYKIEFQEIVNSLN